MRLLLAFVLLVCVAPPSSAQHFRHIGPLTIAAAAHARPAQDGPEALFRGGPPYNDLCVNAVVHPLAQGVPVTITGDNTGSTDTESFGNPVSWEAFSIGLCATVTVDYCGTDPLFEWVYSILITGCPEFVASVQNSGTSFCGDGNTSIVYENLPADTYYIPVLRMAGATGPYTITVSAASCDLPPPNDGCPNAQQIPVVEDCSTGAAQGTNANTVTDGTPACAGMGTQFQDVWYAFDSGTATEVLITIAPGTIGDIGVEVMEACAGPSIFCATGATEYGVGVVPGTSYVVRVFSDNSLGLGGTFGICLSIPPGDCAAETPVALDGGTAAITCVNGDPVVFTSEGTGSGLVFVLTENAGTIILVADTPIVPVDGLAPGAYQLWGVSFSGDLAGAVPGQPLDGLLAMGGCLDVSDAPLEVIIEVCTSIPEQGDALPVRMDGDAWLIWSGAPQRIALSLYDARGALVLHKVLRAAPGQPLLSAAESGLVPGVYSVRATGEDDAPRSARVFVH